MREKDEAKKKENQHLNNLVSLLKVKLGQTPMLLGKSRKREAPIVELFNCCIVFNEL